jgi:hypothetical protein
MKMMAHRRRRRTSLGVALGCGHARFRQASK